MKELSVIKEFIQNADDAGATEINICYDARIHTKEQDRLYFPNMRKSHGPALVIQNNSKFSDDDFNNILKLAAGTKRIRRSKIGKFGVGFCTSYHILLY